ncbi:unnamed protein product [Pleuronectes platessa]|uniref:Uncharacterized protein n=1 Tax=Pleuronectes platessa TaxID=8262 RepID=A0A9N7Z1X4_PLEPL|nr:unnamed protein product [Pleuronectes platessa]
MQAVRNGRSPAGIALLSLINVEIDRLGGGSHEFDWVFRAFYNSPKPPHHPSCIPRRTFSGKLPRDGMREAASDEPSPLEVFARGELEHRGLSTGIPAAEGTAEPAVLAG